VAMYGLGMHPLLDFLTIVGGLALGYLFASDQRGPLAHMSPVARWTGMIAVTFVGIGVLGPMLALLTPLVNGQNNAQAVLEFLGGLLMLVALGAAYLALRGDVRIQVQRRGYYPPETPVRSGPVQVEPTRVAAVSNAPGSDRCPHCSRALKPGAVFCSGCGSNIGAAV